MSPQTSPQVFDAIVHSARWQSRVLGFRDFLRGRLHRKFRPDVGILKNFIPPSSLVLDIGSNHGRFAIEVADLYSGTQKCMVHTFEPVEYNLNVQANVLGRRKNVQVHRYGLSDQHGEFRIYTPMKDNGQIFHGGSFLASEEGFLRIAKERKDYGYVTQMVICKPLDCVLAQRKDKVSFIKMDVEGHELEAMKGGKEILSCDHPTLLFESRGDPAPLQFLHHLGYQFYDLDRCEEGDWTEDAEATANFILKAEKHHDVLAWHPGKEGDCIPPRFAYAFAGTRFGQ